MTVRAEIQSLSPSALIEVFEIDATAQGAPAVLYYHNGTNELKASVVWQGKTYIPLPIEATGFEWSGKGQLPRPKIKVCNVDGLFGAEAAAYADLLGAKFTRRRTHAKFLDAVNFTAGNPNADPTQSHPDEIWFFDRKSGENDVYLEFELSTPFDVAGVMLPGRQFVQNVCPWVYRGSECGYTGGAVAMDDDTLTTNLALDRCGKRIPSCKLRHGTYAVLPYGGFPGAGRVM